MEMLTFGAPSILFGKAIGGKPIEFFRDFIVGYPAVDAALMSESDPTGTFSETADRGEWLVTQDAGGTLPVVQDDADGGWIAFTSDGDMDDQMTVQLNGESFLLARGRRLMYETRLRFDLMTENALWGMSVNTTDPLTTAPSDYIAFNIMADGDLLFVSDAASAGTTATDTGVNLTAATFATFAFVWDGIDTIRAYVNGVKVYSTTTTIPVGAYLSPFYTVQAVANALTATVDWIYIANERAAT